MLLIIMNHENCGGYHYAITIRNTRKPIDRESYQVYLDWLSDRGDVSHVHFESNRGLHCHAQCWTPREFSFDDWYMAGLVVNGKLQPKFRGWNVKAVPIFNTEGWIKYCEKEQLKFEDQITYSPPCPIPTRRLFSKPEVIENAEEISDDSSFKDES